MKRSRSLRLGPKRPSRARRLFAALALGLVVVASVCVARALTLSSQQREVPALAPMPVDEAAAAARLAEAVQLSTLTLEDQGPVAPEAFVALAALLAERYPRMAAATEREVLPGGSLLYRWPGADPKLPPVLLLGHLDVVPAEGPGWSHPPFAGVVEGGFVWGRGTLDDKGAVVAIHEAVEALLEAGVKPRRTLYLAFGHDEEVGGGGAKRMAALLAERGAKPLFILDEGLAITDGIVPGIAEKVAFIGVAEKGFVNVELTVAGAGGHSSMPPRETAAGVLARAVSRVQEARMPGGLDGLTEQTFETLAPEMPFGPRLLFANLWLTAPLVEQLFARSPSTDALLRTTVAPTMLEGSPKANVLPQSARAVINFRIRPGQTIDEVLAHVREVIDDPRVALRARDEFRSDPSPVSSTDSAGYRAIEQAVREVFPGTLVAPNLVLGATDARSYQALSPFVYRFTPTVLGPGDLPRIHGDDERISTKGLADAIRFYRRLLELTLR